MDSRQAETGDGVRPNSDTGVMEAIIVGALVLASIFAMVLLFP